MPVKKTDPETSALKAGGIPRHVAIIMDGNGRWAARRLLPRIEGHRAGSRSVRRVMEESVALGIRCLTLYTFSMENWERPEAEVSELMSMLRQHLRKERPKMLREGIRLRAIGELGRLPERVRATLADIEAATAGGEAMDLVLALSYGSRQEMAAAASSLAASCARGEASPADMDARLFASRLYTAGLPPLDMVVRTSGECRLSNFLLWQAVGAYLHTTPVLWPDFGRDALRQAIAEWQSVTAARGAA